MDNSQHHHHDHATTTTLVPHITPSLSEHNHHTMTFQVWTTTSLLIRPWSLDSVHGLGLAVALSAFLSVVYEGSKFYYHIGKILHHPEQNNRWRGTTVAHYVSRMWKALAYMIHFLIGYVLMLCSMTYNLWILVAVCLGSGIGYFFLLPLIQHVLHRNTDHEARVPSDHNISITCSHRSDGAMDADNQVIELNQHHRFDDMVHVEVTRASAEDVIDERSPVDLHGRTQQQGSPSSAVTKV